MSIFRHARLYVAFGNSSSTQASETNGSKMLVLFHHACIRTYGKSSVVRCFLAPFINDEGA